MSRLQNVPGVSEIDTRFDATNERFKIRRQSKLERATEQTKLLELLSTGIQILMRPFASKISSGIRVKNKIAEALLRDIPKLQFRCAISSGFFQDFFLVQMNEFLRQARQGSRKSAKQVTREMKRKALIMSRYLCGNN